MAGKHVPERTCIACGEKRPQRDFLRVASQVGAAPVLDTSGRAPGRGAYLCKRPECGAIALKRRALERALKLTAPLDEEWKTGLRTALENAAAAEQQPVGDDSMN